MNPPPVQTIYNYVCPHCVRKIGYLPHYPVLKDGKEVGAVHASCEDETWKRRVRRRLLTK